jgi:hypothetical protein
MPARRTDYQRQRILDDFADGQSLREITGHYGNKNNYPITLARRAGWPPRPKPFEGPARDAWIATVRLLTGKSTVIVVVLCAIAAVLLASARGPKPISEPPVTVALAAPAELHRFNERWPDSLKQLDLLDPIPMLPIRMVKTENIRLETEEVSHQTDEPVEVMPMPLPRPRSIRKRMGARDICTRHKMHKVYTRGGRSWRCRR